MDKLRIKNRESERERERERKNLLEKMRLKTTLSKQIQLLENKNLNTLLIGDDNRGTDLMLNTVSNTSTSGSSASAGMDDLEMDSADVTVSPSATKNLKNFFLSRMTKSTWAPTLTTATRMPTLRLTRLAAS